MYCTICIWSELDNVADPHVDHPQEALVLLLELLLVKYLDCQYAVLIHSAVVALARIRAAINHAGAVAQIKALVPVWTEGALGDDGSLRLLAVNGSNGERVRKACGSRLAGGIRLGQDLLGAIRKTSRL